MVLKIGKSVLEVGKMLFLLYIEETSEVFILYILLISNLIFSVSFCLG